MVPKAAAGRRVVLVPDFGGEALVFVNGKAAAARDKEHREITLSRRAKAGERFAVLAEAYAGHGPQVSSGGPVPPGRETVPEPGPTQAVVGECSFGIWEEDVYQLALDVETLYQLRGTLDPDSLRVSEIDQGLRGVRHARRFRAAVRAHARDRAPVPQGARAPARLRQREHRARAARLRPRPHRRGVAVAARRDRAQGRAHPGEPARPHPRVPGLPVPAERAAPVPDAEGEVPRAVRARGGRGARGTGDRRGRDVGRGGHQHQRWREPGAPVPPRPAVLPRGVRRAERAAVAARRVRVQRAACPRSCAGAAFPTSRPRRSTGRTTAAIRSRTPPSTGRASTAPPCSRASARTTARTPIPPPSRAAGTSGPRRTASRAG